MDLLYTLHALRICIVHLVINDYDEVYQVNSILINYFYHYQWVHDSDNYDNRNDVISDDDNEDNGHHVDFDVKRWIYTLYIVTIKLT